VTGADDLALVVALEGDIGKLTIGQLWSAGGVIRALYEALDAMLPQVSTGPRDDARDIAHWKRERELGNGEASRVLAAYTALAKARGEA
jgi:hypothetical protein